jgi:hypothetical protein
MMTRRLPPEAAGAALGAGGGTAATGEAAGAGDVVGDDLAAAGELMTLLSYSRNGPLPEYLTQLSVALGSIRGYKSNWLLR